MGAYIGRKGEIRLYDSTPTPYYISMKFDAMDFSAPEGKARPEETLILHREGLSTDMHNVATSERVIAEPVELSFSGMLDSLKMRKLLRQAINAASSASPWTVGAHSWVTTKGDSTNLDIDGNSITTPAFADTRKTCVNVEVLWDEGAADIGRQYMEVYFAPDAQTIGESEEAVTISCTGQIYGLVGVSITAFTAGTESVET